MSNRSDAMTLFAAGIERLHAAQNELALAQKNMEDIRRYVQVGTMNQTRCYTYVMGRMTTITSYRTL